MRGATPTPVAPRQGAGLPADRAKTTLDVYAVIGVPEVWIYSKESLTIYLYQNSTYQESSTSNIFPNLNIIEMIPKLIKKAIADGTSKMLRELPKTF